MKRRNLETEIEYLGVKLDVHYTVDGHYIPATREEPEEFAELNITKVFTGDVEITNILLECQFEDIYELLNDKLEL
jgi:hypothetical protein